MARIFVEAYGCSASFADSEMISGLVRGGGHTLVDDPAGSDLGLVVTCSVKDATASRMMHRIRSLGDRPLVVAGCLPKAERAAVEGVAGGASLMGPGAVHRALEVVESALAGRRTVALDDAGPPKTGLPKVRLNPAVGIVEIASGCMSECTFCQTKLAKGGLASYGPGDIVRQVRAELADGCREIWLTSTDNGCYGLDIGTDLPSLVRAVSAIPGDYMIRVGMMNPMYMPRIRGGLLESFESPRVFRFLHVPVQSGSDAVLRSMARGHTAGTFRDVVRRARDRFGRFTISTDIIVGYPTETPEDLEETAALLEETRPDVVNLSRYSARPGTEAASMPQIDAAESKRRSRRIHEQVRRITLEANKEWIGWTGRVLFDERTEGGIRGRNLAYKPIYVGDGVDVGRWADVTITGATANSLTGELAS